MSGPDLSQFSDADLEKIAAGVALTPGDMAAMRQDIANMQSARSSGPVAAYRSADKDTGASAEIRAKASLPITEEGKQKFLESRYGQGNVMHAVDQRQGVDSWLVRNSPTDQWGTLDEQSLSFADLADFAGPAIETVPAITGGVAGSAVAGPGGAFVGGELGAAAGHAARQAAAAAIAGESIPLADRAKAAAVNQAASLAGSTVGAGLGMVAKELMPSRMVGRAMISAANKESAELGIPAAEAGAKAEARQRLAAETGIPITAGQAVGSRSALQTEEMIAKAPGGANVFQAFMDKQTRGVNRFFESALRRVSSGSTMSPAAQGNMIAGARNAWTRSMAKARSEMVDPMFQAAREAGGDSPVIPVGNYLSSLDDAIKQFKSPVMSDTADRIISALERRRDDMLSTIGKRYGLTAEETAAAMVDGSVPNLKLTVSEMQNSLSAVGKMLHGGERLIPEIPRGSEKALLRKLHTALQEDLSAAAEDQAAGPVAVRLKDARDAYASATRAMEDSQNKVLDAIAKETVNGGPDKVGSVIVAKSAAQIESAVVALGKMDPAAQRQLRAAGLARILESTANAKETAMGAAVGSGELSPAKIVSASIRNRDKIKALFAGDPEGWAQWQKGIEATQNALRKGFVGESPSAPLLWRREFWAAMTQAVVDPKGAAKQMGLMLNARRFAMAMTDPQQSKIMLGLMRPKYPVASQEAGRMASRAIEMMRRDEWLFGDSGGADADQRGAQ